MWFNILKLVPENKDLLSFVLVNRNQTDKMLVEVANLTKEPKELRSLLRTIKGNNPSLEEVIQTYSNTPHADLELSEIKANVVKLEEAIAEMMVGLKDPPFKTVSELKILVDKGMIARNAGDDAQVKEILVEIDKRNTFSRQKLSSNRDIRDKLDVLRIKASQPYISFEGFPDNSKILQDFAKLLGQEFKNNIILVNYSSVNDFILSMTPKTKKTGKGKKMVVTVVDDATTLTKKKEIQEFYKKNISGKKWTWHSDGNKTNLNDKVSEKKLFVASNTKLSLTGVFSSASVLRYIKAVDATGGSVSKFKPTDFPNGSRVPLVLLLEKSSVNAMNLNPYAKMILTNVLKGNWFKKLFDSIRMNQMITEKQAYSMILADILIAIKTPNGTSKYSISDADINSIRNSITNIPTKTDDTIKEEIKKLLDGSRNLTERLGRKLSHLRAGQLEHLKDNFTIKEAKSFKEYYRELVDDDPEEMKELNIQYFRDGYPTDTKSPKLDEDKKEMVDSAGATIMETIENAEEANYAKIILDGEQLTPETAYEEGLKVTTPKEQSTPTDEIVTDGVSYKHSKGKEEKKNLKTTKEKRALLGKKPLGKNSQGVPETQSDRDGQLEIMDTKIKNLERDIKQSEERLKTGANIRDLGDATSRLRHDLLNMSSFSAYVIDLAKKLKDDGGLVKLISTTVRDASAFEQITAERSLGFLGLMAEHANNDEVGKAFKTIDSDPESDNAIKVAEQLDAVMPSLLAEMKVQIVGAFKSKLEDFANNPAQFPDKQVMAAKLQFVDKYNLLTEGE